MKSLEHILLDENTILDTELKRINIYYENNQLSIELLLSNFRRNSEFSSISLVFNDIIEYNFYYKNDYYFYNIENFKLHHNKEEVYLSLDPDENTSGASENDMDFIKARCVVFKPHYK